MGLGWMLPGLLVHEAVDVLYMFGRHVHGLFFNVPDEMLLCTIFIDNSMTTQ